MDIRIYQQNSLYSLVCFLALCVHNSINFTHAAQQQQQEAKPEPEPEATTGDESQEAEQKPAEEKPAETEPKAEETTTTEEGG